MRTTAHTCLRIRSADDTYSGSRSTDGQNWVAIGSHDRISTERHVGLVGHQTSMEIAAEFDYFSLSVEVGGGRG